MGASVLKAQSASFQGVTKRSESKACSKLRSQGSPEPRAACRQLSAQGLKVARARDPATHDRQVLEQQVGKRVKSSAGP